MKRKTRSAADKDLGEDVAGARHMRLQLLGDDQVAAQLKELINELFVETSRGTPIQKTITDFMSLIDHALVSIHEWVTNIEDSQAMVYKHFAEMHMHMLSMQRIDGDIEALLSSAQPQGPMTEFIADNSRIAPVARGETIFSQPTMDEDLDVREGEILAAESDVSDNEEWREECFEEVSSKRSKKCRSNELTQPQDEATNEDISTPTAEITSMTMVIDLTCQTQSDEVN